MKEIAASFNLNFKIDVPIYVSKDGTKFELTEEVLYSEIQKNINELLHKHNKKVYKCLALDRSYDFFNFKSDVSNLKYDENDENTYKHFVYKYLKDFYVDSIGSTHYTNGGIWSHFRYDPAKNDLHLRMLSKDAVLSVKDYITLHLTSADCVRYYGTGTAYKHVKDLTKEEQKEFFEFILDSGMFDINGYLNISDNLCEIKNNIRYALTKDRFIFELVLLKCYRDDNLDLLDHICKKYKVDASEMVSKDNLLPLKLLRKIHNKNIHNTYNNNKTMRLETYEGKRLSDKIMEGMQANIDAKKFVVFAKYIKTMFDLDASDFKILIEKVVTGESKKSCKLIIDELR